MLKWILGAAVLIILALAGTCYYGYNKLTGGGDTVAITMGASAERVFATLTTPDSMALWMTTSKLESPTGGAMVAVGDTLRFRSITTRDNASGTSASGDWVVREVSAPSLFVIELMGDTSATKVMITRRDSLVTVGDSTTIYTTFTAPFLDSLSTTIRDSSKVGGSVMGSASKMMIGLMRMTTEEELKGLKKRVEGK
jgi:uncharacterized protein YndB with AHSA1/START domain